jgi:hypothetical protein
MVESASIKAYHGRLFDRPRERPTPAQMRSASAVSVIEALGGAIEITSYAGQGTIVPAGSPVQAAASPRPPDSFAMGLLR